MPPRVPKVIPVSDEEMARQKAKVAARCQRFEVVGGAQPIIDSITRERKTVGEFVMLDPERIIIAFLVAEGRVRPAPEKATAKAAKDS